MEFLLKNGANADAEYEKGIPLLFRMVQANSLNLVELLLKYRANPNVLVNAETPLSLAQRSAKNASSPSGKAAWERMEKLLLDNGANENLVRLSRISYTRPGWPSDSPWRARGTNNLDRYTLTEFFGTMWARQPGGRSSPTPELPFPDLARIIIHRVDSTKLTNTEMPVDLEAIIRSGDCSNDIWLEWGDRISIPEEDRLRTATWSGPTAKVREFLARCMARHVQLVIKETTNSVKLIPRLIEESPASTKPDVIVFSFWLNEVVYGSMLLRVSSDATKVHVTRTDPATRKQQKWTFDLTRMGQGTDYNLWLRDGDVINVPDKQ